MRASSKPKDVYRNTNAAFPLGTRPTVVANATTATGAIISKSSGATTTSKPSTTTSSTSTSSNSKAVAANSQIKKISAQKYDSHKTADPFSTNSKKCKTSFSSAYIQGNVPCRLQSSASKYSLQWDQYAADGFSPELLVVCADGLSETQHPYCLMAPMMFEALLVRTQGCAEMLIPAVPIVVNHIRKALMDEKTLGAGLKALLLFSQCSGNLLLPHLPKLVPVLSKPLRDRKHSDQTMMILGIFEQQCGPEASKLIKQKIPTYQ